MMTKTSTRTTNARSYETDYEDIFEADHDITEAEAADLIAAEYHRFPITKAARRDEMRWDGDAMGDCVGVVDCPIHIYNLPAACYPLGVEREQTERTYDDEAEQED